MKKRIVTIALVAALLATCFAGTYAYLTDNEQATNEFTIGSVAIDLYETVSHTDAKGNHVTAPATDLGKGSDEATTYTYEKVMPGDTMTKVVTVENTGDNEAYIALTIKQENYGDFNHYVDDYFENHKSWGDAGLNEADRAAIGLPSDTIECMNIVTANIFTGTGWGISYEKNNGNNNPLRYMMLTSQGTQNGEVEVLGYGYTNASTPEDPTRYNYAGAIFDQNMSYIGTEMDGNFDSLPGKFTRMWIVYLKVAPGASYTLDLTTVCPAYFDNNSTQAFANMELDIKAFAIQAQGLSEKEAFTELFKTGFDY